jgi:ubiquinone/menaquinone biosynthesis C-methylase UbiE
VSRFDKLATGWDLNPSRVKSALNTTKKIKELIDIRGMDILDYGSGTGLIAFDLFETANSITSMDNSKGMLEALNQKLDEAKITNIKTSLHDANIDKLPKNSFDLIVTAMTLHHIKNPSEFIQNATQALKKGGYLVISDLESEDGTFHSMGNDDVEHLGFNKNQIKEWYKEAGLEIVYLETNEVIEKHRDFNIFLAVGRDV